MSFLITISNLSNERESSEKNPNLKKKVDFVTRKYNKKSNKRLKRWKEASCKPNERDKMIEHDFI
jgi:hypothetical protein